MNDTVFYHFPPELVALLIDTIPLLNRSKKDMISFFKGAAIASSLYQDIEDRVNQQPDEINKYEIARIILNRLCDAGDSNHAIRMRRNVLRRVVEFENFSACWPKDQLKAKGLVADIRDMVKAKDTITRIDMAREEERHERISEQRKRSEAAAKRRQEFQQIRTDFNRLFGMTNPYQRGKALESVMNRLCAYAGIQVRDAFHRVGDESEGIIEQVDGVIALEGVLFLVEVKWWNKPVGVPEISEHLVRLFTREGVRGIFISASEFTKPAVTTCKEALSQRTITLCTLQEIMLLLEQEGDIQDFFRRKVEIARLDKNPYGDLLGLRS